MEPAHHPYKSTTHEEKYYHFKELPFEKYRAITVFARKADNGEWYMSPAFCVSGDQFDRKIGRCVARRKYFLGYNLKVGPTIDYEKARELAIILACKVI